MAMTMLDTVHDERASDGIENHPEDSESLGAVYEELRRTARSLMRRVAWGERLLDPTGLVHEAVLRLIRTPGMRGHADRRYVFAAALRAMRRILVERARARRAVKRGGHWRRVPLDLVIDRLEERAIDVLELHEALERLAGWDPRQAAVIDMRFFFGCTVGEIATHLDLAESTVANDLALARAWLYRELNGSHAGVALR